MDEAAECAGNPCLPPKSAGFSMPFWQQCTGILFSVLSLSLPR